MARASDGDDAYEAAGGGEAGGRHRRRDPRLKELGISCMLNTEVGAILAVIRRPPDPISGFLPGGADEGANPQLLQSLKSLRSLIFHPQHSEWRSTEPSIYLSPFLDVIQSDKIPAAATGVALFAVLKILRLNVFEERTPGAREAIHSVVFAVTNCRLERTEQAAEDAVLIRILQVLVAIVRSRVSVLLIDHAVCTIVNTCFQVVQQSVHRGDLLQRSARHAMHELIQAIFSRLPEIKVPETAEKMLEYSRRENSEREMKSMEGTLKEAMELLVEVFQRFMVPLSRSPGIRTFWLGVLGRMDTCMKVVVWTLGT